MVCPGPSSRASRIAPATLMPDEPPRHRPSSCEQIEDDRQRFLVRDLEGHVDRRALEVRGDAALADALGDRASPRPSARRSCSSCRAPRPSDRRARSRRSGCAPCSAMPTPASVPPVPTAQTKPSTLPSVCSQISGPVVSDVGLRGWRRCRTGWPRSRRSARSRASCSASRPETFT